MSIVVKLRKSCFAEPAGSNNPNRIPTPGWRRAALMLAAALVLLVLPAMAAKKAAPEPKTPPQAVVTLLSAADWKLGSFAMGEGEAKGAFKAEFDDAAFRTVTVPGEVQLQTGLKGKDLFLQSKALNLINNQEWWYRLRFKAPVEAAGKLARLRFVGSSYFTTVWLNGEKLGEHEGEAEGFSVEASRALKPGAINTLAVKVTCPWLPKGRGLAEYLKTSFSLQLPGEIPRLPNPPYFLGGGWGGIPAYGNMSLIMGLYRDVKLVISEPVTVEDLYAYTKSLNADGSATLEISGNAKNSRDGAGEAQIAFDLTPANFKGETIHAPAMNLILQPGDNRFSEELVVSNPQLWWTWDLGAQNLYHLDARLGAGAGGGGDVASTTLGIRTISRDENFAYSLNGKRIFLKGVWYPMADYYPSRATPQSYERDLRLLKGTYSNHLVTQVVEQHEFYELCDELGIMIFIQMPFSQFGAFQVIEAGNPRREPFLKNSRQQVSAIVTELRTHPSIVQWSPLAEAHENGVWRGSPEGYDNFIAEMKKVVTPLSPDTIFHPSLCDLGEKHMWNGNYRDYFDFKPALVSEYGEISPPNLETFKEALTDEQMWSPKNKPRLYNLPIDLEAYKYWTAFQYTAGEFGFGVFNMVQRAHRYSDRNIGSAQELIDAIQLQHAFMLSYPTEAFRRKMHAPISGIRTWAFRDIYPGVQYGMVDSNGIPKMNYYYYRRAQQPLALSFAYAPALESQAAGKLLRIPLWVANDYRRRVNLEVLCEILTPSGEVVWSKSFSAEAQPDASRQIGEAKWITPEHPGVYILRARAIEKNGELKAENSNFIKVAPKAFARPSRVLVIGLRRFGQPISSMLEALGAQVDVIDEATLDRLAELKDAAKTRDHYDVVWLAPLDHLWKLVEPAIGDGLTEAVRQGVGFIHSGGDAAFHGGAAAGACLELTPLAEILPVELIPANEDTVYPAYREGERVPADLKTITEIESVDAAWTDAGLNQYGVRGYNEVNPKPDGKVELTIEGHPLLATGHYGKGRTVVFTGYTPSWVAPGVDFLDEQFDADPATRAYFGIFAQMLAAATGEQPATEYREVLAAREKPLYQMLKEQPTTTLETSAKVEAKAAGEEATVTVDLKAGTGYARLVRLRVAWEGAKPYVTLYDDNYFDMMPGERKSVSLTLKFAGKLPAPAHGRLIVAGSNVKETELPVTVNP